jgi:hypothetical protein
MLNLLIKLLHALTVAIVWGGPFIYYFAFQMKP